MNVRVDDQKAKIRQRLNFLIELERYEEAAGLDARASRLGLLDDEDLTYALAYAHYRAGHVARVEQLLVRLTRPDLYEKATALRQSIAACADNPWECQ